MTSHCETIKSSLNTGSNDKPLETPKSLKHLILIKVHSQNQQKQNKIGLKLAKPWIWSRIEKIHQNPINPKWQKMAKIRSKNYPISLIKWVFGKMPTFLGKSRKTHFIRGFHWFLSILCHISIYILHHPAQIGPVSEQYSDIWDIIQFPWLTTPVQVGLFTSILNPAAENELQSQFPWLTTPGQVGLEARLIWITMNAGN